MRESMDMIPTLIIGLIVRINDRVWFVKNTKIFNKRDDLRVEIEIRVQYNCILKCTLLN